VIVMYEYYVTEETVIDGYRSSIDGGEITSGEHEGEYAFVITNEPLSPTDQDTEINVEKVWRNADGTVDTSMHKEDAVVFGLTQKKYEAKVTFTYNGHTYTDIPLYPITIDLVDKNAQNSGRRVHHKTVVYVPEGSNFTVNPQYLGNNVSNGQHTVEVAGITVTSGTNPQTTTYQNKPGVTYYYPEATFTLENVDSAKDVMISVHDGNDVWINLHDDKDNKNIIENPSSNDINHQWTCEMHSDQGIIWDLKEMLEAVLSGASDTTAQNPTAPQPFKTSLFQYTMTLTDNETGKPTVITRGENAPGFGVGDEEEVWKGSVTNLPLYEYKGAEGSVGDKTYIYTYEITEAAINSDAVITSNPPATWNGQTSAYLVKWEQDTQTGLWTLTNQLKPSIDIILHKVDKDDLEAGTPLLGGAKFKLIKYTALSPSKQKDTEWGTNGVSDEISEDPNNLGVFSFEGLETGYYEIFESEYPKGYIQADENPIFQVRPNSETHQMEAVLVDASGADINGNATDLVKIENSTITLGNTPGAALPSTGGPGTRLFTILGLVLICFAGVLYVRRRSITE